MSSMTKHPRFVTLSKYPPYRSGHAKQALWNNTALAALTGAEQAAMSSNRSAAQRLIDAYENCRR